MAVSEKRAIGIVRVSRVGGRDGDRFVSPDIQRERIEDACERHSLRLISTLDELDVSGGKPLAQRPGLAQALAAVEARQAEAIVFAYRDRMDRSIDTASELCSRIDAADGLLIADGNIVTHSTHDGWRHATMESFLNEDQRRMVGEKMRAVHERCVERGAPPWSRVPLGYRRQEDGTYAPDPETVPVARRVFEMRGKGATITDIRLMLEAAGDDRSNRGIQVMLANRIYLGELHFGELVNLQACEPIIDRELFDRIQRLKVPRGPKPKSEMLLARLGVLRCGSCNSRLSASVMPQGGGYPIYRCGSTSDCPHHVVISAKLVEREIVAWVKRALAELSGTASGASGAQEALVELDRAQAALDAAVRSFADTGLGGEPVAIDTLGKLREARDRAKENYDEAAQAQESLSVVVTAGDWDELSLKGRRDLIKATIARAVIQPGRGASRIEIEGR